MISLHPINSMIFKAGCSPMNAENCSWVIPGGNPTHASFFMPRSTERSSIPGSQIEDEGPEVGESLQTVEARDLIISQEG